MNAGQSDIQSVLLDKRFFPEKKVAEAWIKSKKFKSRLDRKPVKASGDEFQFRQRKPERFKKLEVFETPYPGVKFVIGSYS